MYTNIRIHVKTNTIQHSLSQVNEHTKLHTALSAW